MQHHQHISLLHYEVNPDILQTRMIDGLCYVLVILGFVGNILGLFIFSSSRRSWRISSVYACLATTSSITNLLCVIRYASILHSKLRNILHIYVGKQWWACKVYEFSFCFRIFSSWITLFWMFERLLCVSMRLRTSFSEFRSLKVTIIIPFCIIMIILGCVIGPPVYMFEPEILNDQTLMDSAIILNKTYCQLHSNASIGWKRYFNELHFGINHYTTRCIFSELIPTGAVVLFNSYIIYHIFRSKQRLEKIHGHRRYSKQSQTASWMTRVLLLHSLLFLSSLLSHVAAHFAEIEAHETWWVILAILINSSLNFYVYCLSGEAFRNEIHRFIQRFKMRFFHSVYFQEPHRQHCCQKQNISDEINHFPVLMPLRSHSFHDLDQEITT